nr:wiskott-Aldrich syndrome protein homolog 1-like [Aegilops tauschii subsp. strangulata]
MTPSPSARRRSEPPSLDRFYLDSSASPFWSWAPMPPPDAAGHLRHPRTAPPPRPRLLAGLRPRRRVVLVPYLKPRCHCPTLPGEGHALFSLPRPLRSLGEAPGLLFSPRHRRPSRCTVCIAERHHDHRTAPPPPSSRSLAPLAHPWSCALAPTAAVAAPLPPCHCARLRPQLPAPPLPLLHAGAPSWPPAPCDRPTVVAGVPQRPNRVRPVGQCPFGLCPIAQHPIGPLAQ